MAAPPLPAPLPRSCSGLAQNTACQNAATLPPKLAANLTASINAALLPKADNTYTNSTKSDYISFTTPKICYSGNWCVPPLPPPPPLRLLLLLLRCPPKPRPPHELLHFYPAAVCSLPQVWIPPHPLWLHPQRGGQDIPGLHRQDGVHQRHLRAQGEHHGLPDLLLLRKRRHHLHQRNDRHCHLAHHRHDGKCAGVLRGSCCHGCQARACSRSPALERPTRLRHRQAPGVGSAPSTSIARLLIRVLRLPPLRPQTTLDWYPMVGGETGIGIKLTITGLKMVMKVRLPAAHPTGQPAGAGLREAVIATMARRPPRHDPPAWPACSLQGSYTYAVTTATKQACFTAASVSSTTISYTSITGQWIIAGSLAGAVPGKVRSNASNSVHLCTTDCARPPL